MPVPAGLAGRLPPGRAAPPYTRGGRDAPGGDTQYIGGAARACSPGAAARAGAQKAPRRRQGADDAGRRQSPTAARTRSSTSLTQTSRLSFSITGTPCSSAQATMYFWMRRICAKCST